MYAGVSQASAQPFLVTGILVTALCIGNSPAFH
jgi:hypothetical protein